MRSWLALVAWTLAAPAMAQQPERPIDPLVNDAAALAPAGDTASQIAFAYADRNEDLIVTWEEYRNRGMRVFGHVDANGDGVLQVAELAALGGEAATSHAHDIPIGTFNAALRIFFDAGDDNRDGALTPAEWQDTRRPSKILAR
jgi:hypothetical protein